jgi:hypothetical protein
MAKKIIEGSIDGVDSTPKKAVKSISPKSECNLNERFLKLESKINELVELNKVTESTSTPIPTDNELKEKDIELVTNKVEKPPQNHFLNNWKTSLCGLALIMLGIVGRGKDLISSTEAIGFITMGIGLILGKDYDVISRK